MGFVSLLLFVLLSGAVVLSSRHESHRRLFEDLDPRSPRVEFESDGGRLETWGGKGSGVFEDADVAACRVVLKYRGLWMPSYVDVPSLHVVTRGGGRVGIVTPFSDRHVQENTFKVVKGDTVALPQGHVVWWYNDEERDMEIVGVADVTESSRPAGLRAFHLAGSKQEQREEHDRRFDEQKEQSGYGAVIHGFSKDVLARTWGMDKQRVRELLEAQTEGGIVRLDEDMEFSEIRETQDNAFFQNFIYRLSKVQADLRVEDGGEVRELNSHKFPVLKQLGLGLGCMELEPNAMVAPNWFNGHQVLYVVSGCGRIEVVSNNGEKALDTELKAGSLVVIPAFFPSTKIASRDDKFHYISFITSHRPMISFMSGSKSVYQGIPPQVLARMLNVDEGRAKQIQHAHNKESIIFASSAQEVRHEVM